MTALYNVASFVEGEPVRAYIQDSGCLVVEVGSPGGRLSMYFQSGIAGFDAFVDAVQRAEADQ